MLDWLKNIFKSPKTFIKLAVDSLDLLVPTLANEIEKIKGTFAQLNSTEKAQWVVDKVQEYLRKRFNLDA